MKTHLPACRSAFLLSLCLAAGPLAAQTLLFDFGGSGRTTIQDLPPANDPDRTWNNINSVGTAAVGTPAARLDAALSSTGDPTEINLVMISRFNGNNDAGTTASLLYPSNATSDSLYGNTETFGVGANIFPSFKLTGLNQFATYDLTLYASRGGANDNRETQYTVTGAESNVVFLNAANNIDEFVKLSGLKSTAAGEITLLLGPGPNNDNAFHFTYLGVMQLDVTPSQQQPVVFTQEPGDAEVLQGRRVTFTAAVNSTPPYTIVWKEDGQPIPNASGFTYTIEATPLEKNQKRYSVMVSNPEFSNESRAALLTVTPDTTPPTLTGITSLGPWHIGLTFSEELELFNAEDPGNYVVDGGNYFLNAAVLQPDLKSVILEPSFDISTSPVSVSVSNLTDLAGNLIAGASTLSVAVPQPDGKSFLIDFGATTTQQGSGTNDPLNFWNNVTTGIGASDFGELLDLVKSDGTPTTVALRMLARFNDANGTGTLTGGPFAANATRDSLFGNTGDHNGLTLIYPAFKLDGLTPGVPHELVFYASRLAAGDNRETRYTITGSTVTEADLDPADNIVNKLVVPDVIPAADGSITIALSTGPNNTNGVRYIYLGALQITPGAAPAGSPQILTPVIVDGQIIVSWTGTGVLETSTTLSGTWTPVTPAPASPFSEPVVAGQKKFYRIRP